MATGSERIHSERVRQILDEGFDYRRDDEYAYGEMVDAAICYAEAANWARLFPDQKAPMTVCDGSLVWPWAKSWWKPSDDPIRNLEKAGALIAAEIDRLQREAKRLVSA